MIVLNEHEWAEEKINSRSLGTKPFETLSRVGRYYLDSGRSKKEARAMLDSFVLQCEPSASLIKWSSTLDAALLRASKYNAITVDCIEISEGELETIGELQGVQLKRLAFTLLCLSKYWLLVNEQNDYWVCCKDGDIMEMANVKTSIKRQAYMYHVLYEEGLIRFSKKIDNTRVRVCFAEEGEVAMRISDMRNLGYQYMAYTGDKSFFKCQSCGLISRKNKSSVGRPQKYCKDCSASHNHPHEEKA